MYIASVLYYVCCHARYFPGIGPSVCCLVYLSETPRFVICLIARVSLMYVIQTSPHRVSACIACTSNTTHICRAFAFLVSVLRAGVCFANIAYTYTETT